MSGVIFDLLKRHLIFKFNFFYYYFYFVLYFISCYYYYCYFVLFFISFYYDYYYFVLFFLKDDAKFSVSSVFVDQKVAALQTLAIIAYTTKADFVPYLGDFHFSLLYFYFILFYSFYFTVFLLFLSSLLFSIIIIIIIIVFYLFILRPFLADSSGALHSRSSSHSRCCYRGMLSYTYLFYFILLTFHHQIKSKNPEKIIFKKMKPKIHN